MKQELYQQCVSSRMGWFQYTGTYSIELNIKQCGDYNFIGIFNTNDIKKL